MLCRGLYFIVIVLLWCVWFVWVAIISVNCSNFCVFRNKNALLEAIRGVCLNSVELYRKLTPEPVVLIVKCAVFVYK